MTAIRTPAQTCECGNNVGSQHEYKQSGNAAYVR
jgi:hypothetical protein